MDWRETGKKTKKGKEGFGLLEWIGLNCISSSSVRMHSIPVHVPFLCMDHKVTDGYLCHVMFSNVMTRHEPKKIHPFSHFY